MTHFSDLDCGPYLLDQALGSRVLTPALAVHLDLVRGNVRRVIAHLDGQAERWRPHVKTTKIPAVWRILAEEGVRHFKCATTRELDVLLRTLDDAGVQGADVLVSYPHRPPALERIASIAKAHPGVRVAVLIEEVDLIDVVPECLGLFIDINPGMNRTGVPASDTETLLRLVVGAGERYRGLHWYDGHVYDGDMDQRRSKLKAGLEQAAQLIATIRSETRADTEELISAGTPAFLASLGSQCLAASPDTVHRLSPGTVVFHDLRSQIENSDLGLTPAAVILTRVISHPSADLITCDAGTKSIAVDGQPLCEVIGHPELVPLVPSEEHLPFEIKGADRPARGSLLALVPGHICPTVNLAEEALLFDSGRFLGSTSVSARAHELLLPVPKSEG